MKKLILFLGVLFFIQFFSSCSGTKASSSSVTKAPKKTVADTKPSQTKTSKDILKKYSDKLDVHISKLETPMLYEMIDEWIGVPYRYAGLSKKGIDCSGFVSVVYKNITHKTVPRTTKDLYNSISAISRSQLQEGDLVFFNYSGKKNSHVGIYLHNGKFVHASSSKGVIISDLNNPHYKQTFSKGGPLKMGRLKQLVN